MTKHHIFLILGVGFTLGGAIGIFVAFQGAPIFALGPAILLAVGVGMLAFGIMGMIRGGSRSKDIAWLKTSGKMIVAAIDHVDQDTTIRVNGRTPFVVYSHWTDPATQKTYVFASDHLWVNPMVELADKKTVNVFIDPGNPAKYFVDLASLGGNVGAMSQRVVAGTNKLFVIAMIVPIFMAVVGLVAFGAINSFVSNQLAGGTQFSYLKGNGKEVAATITDIRQDRSIIINYQIPYIIDAQWSDASTSKVYTFSSTRIWQDPNFALRNATSVAVYLDPQNYNNYYVDLSSVGL